MEIRDESGTFTCLIIAWVIDWRDTSGHANNMAISVRTLSPGCHRLEL